MSWDDAVIVISFPELTYAVTISFEFTLKILMGSDINYPFTAMVLIVFFVTGVELLAKS